MAGERKNYATQRIDELLDDRINDVRDDIKAVQSTVTDIRKMLIGNGSGNGIVQIVSKNSARIKVLFLILGGTLVGGGVGGVYGINNGKASVESPRPEPIVSNVSNVSTN